jgi:hypothetical protein
MLELESIMELEKHEHEEKNVQIGSKGVLTKKQQKEHD